MPKIILTSPAALAYLWVWHLQLRLVNWVCSRLDRRYTPFLRRVYCRVANATWCYYLQMTRGIEKSLGKKKENLVEETMGEYLLRMGELSREKCSWREPDNTCNFFEDGISHPQCNHDPKTNPCSGFHNETLSG